MIAALILVAALCAADAPEAPDAAFDQFFAEFKAKRDGIESLEAKFTQKTIVPDETLATDGSIFYAKPRRILLRTEDPDRSTMVDGRLILEYEPEIRQLVIYDLGENPRADVFFLGFDDDTESLRRNYDVHLFTTPDETAGGRGILLRPKDPDGEGYDFIEARLYLRDADFLPHRIHIQNDEDSEVIINVRDYRINIAPDPARAQIFAPEGTKVIKDDRVLKTVGPDGERYPEALEQADAAVPAPPTPVAGPSVTVIELDAPRSTEAPQP